MDNQMDNQEHIHFELAKEEALEALSEFEEELLKFLEIIKEYKRKE